MTGRPDRPTPGGPAPDGRAPRRGRLRRLLERVLREHSTPRRLGAAVATGIFIGCSPLYGLHAYIGIAVALPLRLNKVAVVLGTQISTPPLVFPLTFCSIQIGSLITTGHFLGSELTAQLSWDNMPRLAATFALLWAVGGVVTGAVLGGIAYLITVAFRRRVG